MWSTANSKVTEMIYAGKNGFEITDKLMQDGHSLNEVQTALLNSCFVATVIKIKNGEGKHVQNIYVGKRPETTKNRTERLNARIDEKNNFYKLVEWPL